LNDQKVVRSNQNEIEFQNILHKYML